MQKIASIFLTIVFLLQSVSYLEIMLSYDLNRQYIIEHLCINRQKPKLKCNGKCYLKRQLEKEKQDTGRTERKSELKTMLLFFENSFLTLNIPDSRPVMKTFYRFVVQVPYPKGVFHPPEC